jgi:hypothetical protein
MLFHTPGNYLEPEHPLRVGMGAPEWEYYYKHGFSYATGPREQESSWLPGKSYLSVPSPLEETASSILPEAKLLAEPDPHGFVTGLIADKSRFAKAAVQGLVSQIYERQEIKEHNLTKIDHDGCMVGTLLNELFIWGDARLSDKRRQTLDMVMFGLERERRAEEVACWRDISLLRKDLVEAMAEYAAAARREQLFEHGSGLG